MIPSLFSQVRMVTVILSMMLAVAPAGAQQPEAPGELVDIGGYKLHINCTGAGLPTIVLDSGAGGFSLEWSQIQKVLSRHNRVCAYDRAGYGWSDMGPLPRTSKRITRELFLLLQNSGATAPYIMAGHSFGGFTAQFFAREYPQLTAALVLIDSSHPEQVYRLPDPETGPSRRQLHNTRSYIVSFPVIHPRYPAESTELAKYMMSSWKHTMTWREEIMGMPISGMQVRRANAMPDIPVVVITRGERVWPESEYGNEMERVWMELQDELSELGSRHVHLIAEGSGHSIHLDQPVYVLNAFNSLLQAKKTGEGITFTGF